MIIKVLDLETRMQRSESATRLAITYAPSGSIGEAVNRSCGSELKQRLYSVQRDELVLSKAYLPLACMRPDVGTDVLHAKRVNTELHSRT